jgi:hypothetical protein
MNTKNKITSGEKIRMWWFGLSLAVSCGVSEDTPLLLMLLLAANLLVSGISVINTETVKKWNREEKL